MNEDKEIQRVLKQGQEYFGKDEKFMLTNVKIAIS